MEWLLRPGLCCAVPGSRRMQSTRLSKSSWTDCRRSAGVRRSAAATGSAASTASAADMQAAEGRSGNTATCRRAAETGIAAGTGTGIGGIGMVHQTIGDEKMTETAAASSTDAAGTAVQLAAVDTGMTGIRTGEESGRGTADTLLVPCKLGCAVSVCRVVTDPSYYPYRAVACKQQAQTRKSHTTRFKGSSRLHKGYSNKGKALCCTALTECVGRVMTTDN